MPKALSQEEFEKRIADYTNDSVIVISKYINKRTQVLIKCKVCGHEWYISPTTIMPNNMSQYSFSGCQKCKYQEIECSYCHKKFQRLKTELGKNKSGYYYCSKECGNKHKNELITNITDGSNYRRNAFLCYPHKCDICGWDEDERILEVHHLDSDHSNNDVSNLRILCPICHKKISLKLYTYDELKINS